MAVSMEVWVPVGTLVLGYSLNLIREWLRDHRKRQRENDSREFRLKARNRARRAAFQRKTLDELHQAIRRHAQILNNPTEEAEFRARWFDRLHETRVKIISLATVIGDAPLLKTSQEICDLSKHLELWASQWWDEWDFTEEEKAQNQVALNTVQGEMFLQVNRRVLELQRDVA